MTGRGAVLRLLLFGIIAAGIAGMHTLGHPSAGGHGGHTPPGVTRTHGSAVTHVAMAATAVAGSASDAAAIGVGRGLDPSTVCLAVLVAFGLAALVAALLVAARHGQPPGRYRNRIPSLAGRGPPAHPWLGLRLAGLSVQRT
jgi:hypothetical protein